VSRDDRIGGTVELDMNPNDDLELQQLWNRDKRRINILDDDLPGNVGDDGTISRVAKSLGV